MLVIFDVVVDFESDVVTCAFAGSDIGVSVVVTSGVSVDAGLGFTSGVKTQFIVFVSEFVMYTVNVFASYPERSKSTI